MLWVIFKEHKKNASSVPLILLQPDQAVRVLHIVFPASNGILPGNVNFTTSKTNNNLGTELTSAVQQTNQTPATILLTLAKLFQDIMNPTTPVLITAAASASSFRTPPTLSTLLPLYYLSLALNPSPSTANNLGIILSNIPGAVALSAVRLDSASTPPLTGTMLAMQYYMYGLQLDAHHPHLYTNLGQLSIIQDSM
ncbi:hypothetical protein G6F68_012978 [Rhizopus microsporus]|nr:hypothetical protein G6F68_012978 [Rhizopus microsporus]